MPSRKIWAVAAMAVAGVALPTVSQAGAPVVACLTVTVPETVDAGSEFVVTWTDVAPDTTVELSFERAPRVFEERTAPSGQGALGVTFDAPLAEGLYPLSVTAQCPDGAMNPTATWSRPVMVTAGPTPPEASCGSMDVTPNPAEAGTRIVVSGSGATPGASGDMTLRRSSGGVKVKRIPVGDDGTFSKKIRVDTMNGTYPLRVRIPCGSDGVPVQSEVLVTVVGGGVAPSVPLDVTVEREAEGPGMTLSWMAPVRGSEPIDYFIQRRKFQAAAGEWSDWKVISKGYTLDPDSGRYATPFRGRAASEFRLRASNEFGESNFSPTVGVEARPEG